MRPSFDVQSAIWHQSGTGLASWQPVSRSNRNEARVRRLYLSVAPGIDRSPCQKPDYSPPSGAEISTSAVFSWIDAPPYSGYRLLFRRKDTGAIVASVDVGGNDAMICPNDSYCRFAGGMPKYPKLETREYEWVVFAKNSTGIWQWWHPGTWSSFYVMPRIPIAVTGEWIGNKLLLNWPSSPDTTQYRADIDNVFTKIYTEDYLCSTSACGGESDVRRVDYLERSGSCYGHVESMVDARRMAPRPKLTERHLLRSAQ